MHESDQMAKVVIVTGASRGLGLEICKKLLEDNYRVVGLARSASEATNRLLETKGNFVFRNFDLSDTARIHGECQDIVQAYGRPYGLINNAAVGLDGILTTMHESDIKRLLTVNVEAPILLCKYLSRPMLLNRCGRIVNVSSIIASTGYKGLAVYAATKSAMIGLTKSFCREVGKASITVNCVAPGFMETEMTDGIDAELLKSIRRRSPLGELTDVEQVAASVAYLLSDSASRITGSVLTVDAGSTA